MLYFYSNSDALRCNSSEPHFNKELIYYVSNKCLLQVFYIEMLKKCVFFTQFRSRVFSDQLDRS